MVRCLASGSESPSPSPIVLGRVQASAAWFEASASAPAYRSDEIGIWTNGAHVQRKPFSWTRLARSSRVLPIGSGELLR